MEYISLKKHPNPKEQDYCMVVLDKRDTKKRAILCIMPISLKGDQTLKELRNNWVYDIKFFKEKCKDNELTMNAFDNEIAKLLKQSTQDPYILRKKYEILSQNRDEILQKIREKNEDLKEKNIAKNVEKIAKEALEVFMYFYLKTIIFCLKQTLEKELNYEQLIIHEEMLRENKEEKELQKQIQIEKQKEVNIFTKNNKFSQKISPRPACK